MSHRTFFVFVLLGTALTQAAHAGDPPSANPPATAAAPTAAFSTPVLDPAAIDRSVDPCVDFYAYACGGWLAKNPIPADRAAWSVYGKLQEENNTVLRSILEQAAAGGSGRDATSRQIGDYYASCMDEVAVEKAGTAPLHEDLARIAALRSTRDIPAWLASFHLSDERGGGSGTALFGFYWMSDFRDSNRAIAVADQSGLGLPDRDHYLNDDSRSQELRQRYKSHVQAMLMLGGKEASSAATAAEAVLRIETVLAKASMTRVERRDARNRDHLLSLGELAALTPAFDWDAYLRGLGLEGLTSLNVAAPGFFKAMDTLLEHEELWAWKAYLRWYLVHARAKYLASAFVAENFAFYGKALTGTQELEPRWKRCVSLVDRDLGEVLGQAYVARRFSPEAKQRTVRMVEGVERAMEVRIRELPWMSDATKVEALAKLHGVRNKVGYPDRWRDYSALSITRGDLVGDVSRSQVFLLRRELAKIGKPVDRSEWGISPATVNAYYSFSMNDINFPAGILQPPLFDPRSDGAPNYGDTGGTIGHELVHGFDDSGRRFDAAGKLRDWWTAEDAGRFEERAQCVIDQYSQYSIVDDVRINGKLTAGEDIADLGGLVVAWGAWKEASRGQDLAPLQGFTPEQRFFIGYGQSWCGDVRDEAKRLRATTDPHSPARYRANGVVANLPEFAQAFACKAGQPMVRPEPCRIW